MGSCWCKALKVSNRILNLIRSFYRKPVWIGQKWSDVVVFAGTFNQAGGSILLIEAFSKHTSAHYAKKSSSMSSLEDTKSMDENLSNISEHSNFPVWEMLRTWYKADLQTFEMGKHGHSAVKNDTDILAELDW